MLRSLAWIGVASAITFSAIFARAEFAVPPLSAPVMDRAGIIDPDAAATLDSTLRELRERGGPQVNVLTLSSLEGLPIEQVTIKIVDAWKLGDQKRDDGVLLLVALKERQMRIEVGQGLEGVLTDLASKRIISDEMAPYFRSGHPSDGIVVGVRSILSLIAPGLLKASPNGPPRMKQRHRDVSRFKFPVILLIALFLWLAGRGRGGRRGGFLSGLATGAILSGGSGGRGSWSGGGGSGWSGGGGGFSGGGASGGW